MPTRTLSPLHSQYRDMADPMKVVLQVSWTYAFPRGCWQRGVSCGGLWVTRGACVQLCRSQLQATAQSYCDSSNPHLHACLPRADPACS